MLGIGVVAVSTAAILVRLAIAGAGRSDVGFSLVLASVRLGMAALVLLPNWRPLLQNAPQTSAWGLAIASGVALAIHFATWISSLAYTSIAASTTLVTTNPIWVALLAWLLWGEKLRPRLALGIAIAIGGGILIGSDSAYSGGGNPWLGNALAIVGAWAASAYLLLGRAAQQRGMNTWAYSTVSYTTAAIVLLPLPWLMGSSYTGYPALVYGWMALMAVVPQLIGHTSFNWGMRYLSPTIVALILLLEPVISSILGYLIFQELPGHTSAIGAVLILLGVACSIGAASNKPAIEAPQEH